MLLRARIVLPLVQPPIEDGAVGIHAGEISFVGRWSDTAPALNEPVVDLGDSLLLPGLVNAHCHLDYTHMAGQLLPTRMFADWIQEINALKHSWSKAEYLASWQAGAAMLLRSGVTTVGDIEAVPAILPEVRAQCPLRVCSFVELIGIRPEKDPAHIVRDALAPVDCPEHRQLIFGLSPHAPYSTTPALLEYSCRLARQNQWRLTVHLAESQPEFDMFMERRGPLFDWLKSQRNVDDCGQGSPLRHLERFGGLADDFLAVHLNYLAEGDLEILQRHRVSIAHCPRSHAFFQHQVFALPELIHAGINLCLGTDSLATVTPKRDHSSELSLFTEMQVLAQDRPDLSAEIILRMATRHGARALGLEGKAGALAPRSWADLLVLPYHGAVKDVYEAAVYHRGPIRALMIAGRWILGPPDAAVDSTGFLPN